MRRIKEGIKEVIDAAAFWIQNDFIWEFGIFW